MADGRGVMVQSDNFYAADSNGNIEQIVCLFVFLYLLGLLGHHSKRLAVPQFGVLFLRNNINNEVKPHVT
ncbi:hypothetical protein DF182_25840 [Chitinophaga flava]|uniref:Uncharacterized protein n=1 Tax=Chitinophaga flava TaxID=2259036 RepID=A0A365XU63_9BACT|nr:hypothetical protein DF182_25840 [Chitinophaga flava]